MPDPLKSIRQKIVDAVVARMQTIQVTNGFETNLGLQVEDSRDSWDAETELLEASSYGALSVFDLATTEAAASPESDTSIQYVDLPVQLQIFTAPVIDEENGITRAIVIRRMLADVYEAIKVDRSWPGEDGIQLAMWTSPKASGFTIPENNETLAAIVEINIRYQTQIFNAYE